MARPAKHIPSRTVRLLDGPPKKTLADLGSKTPPPEPEDPSTPRTALRVVAGIRIEDHIPLPTRGGRVSRFAPALAALDVGNSFFMPGYKSAGPIYKLKKAHPGKQFVCKAVSGGVRVWRAE